MMTPLERGATRRLLEISKIARVDQKEVRPKWVHLVRDAYAGRLMGKWLTVCAATPWESVEAQQRMQQLMGLVRKMLPDEQRLAKAILNTTTQPVANNFPPILVNVDDGTDPRLKFAVSVLHNISKAATKAAAAQDLALANIAVAYATSRQTVWMRKVAGLDWKGASSKPILDQFTQLAFRQYQRRRELCEEYVKSVDKTILQTFATEANYKPLSDFDQIHGPAVDIFGVVSAAYDSLEAEGAFDTEPGDDLPDAPSDMDQENVMDPDMVIPINFDELSQEEREELESWENTGGLPPPEHYQDIPDDTTPLPEKK